MLIHRLGRTAGVLSVLLVLAACGTDAPPADDTMIDTAVDTPDAPAGQEFTAELQALDNSGMGGTLAIDVSGAQPMLTVSLTGAPAPGVHQGHIHGGTCADRTGSIEPLEPITTGADGAGQATSTVQMAAGSLMNGNHIVVYHEAGGTPGASLVCGKIPAR